MSRIDRRDLQARLQAAGYNVLKLKIICCLIPLILLIKPITVIARPHYTAQPVLRATAVDIEPVILSPVQPAEPQNQEEVKQMLAEIAKADGVDLNLVLRIVKAESGYSCTIKNKNSSATGLFQFINSTWISTQKRMGRDTDLALKKDCRLNAEAGIYLLSKGELSHWNESKHNWDK